MVHFFHFAALFAFIWCAPVTTLVLDDWLQFGGVHRNFSLPKIAEGQGKQITAWKRPFAGGDASILIQGDNSYAYGIDFAADGTDAHRMECLDRHTGRVIWEQVLPETSFVSQDISERLPVRPISTPIIVKNKLVVCGYGGSVRCLDCATGKQLWAVDLVKDFGATPIQYGYACSPWSDGNRIVIACGGEQALLLSLNLEDGRLNWKSGSGIASYTSPVSISIADSDATTSEQHIVYAAGDEVVGVLPSSGQVEWRYRYPEVGLTNAVTPIAVAPGKLLVGGQGVKGCRLLAIERSSKGYDVREEWHNAKINPFYCNWVQLPNHPNWILGFMGKTLTAFDWTTGAILWQKREWTDGNLLCLNDQVLVVRGDAYIGLLKVDDSGFEVIASGKAIKDRVWAPPTVVGQQLYWIGRNTISCFPLSKLQKQATVPAGVDVTSMDAMYGERPDPIKKLIELSNTGDFEMHEYKLVASDRSIGLTENDYLKITENLNGMGNLEAALSVANDWASRVPDSIAAWERRVQLLRKTGASEQADKEAKERMIAVTFEVSIAAPSVVPDHLFLTGNTDLLGPWKADALELQRTGDRTFRVQCLLPRGDLQFKFTCGSMESVEVRADGRSISNRRQRLAEPITLSATVEGWKKK